MKTPIPFSEIRRRIGERLRELRQDAELTQIEIARRTGSHRPIICRLERGLHDPSLDSLNRYAQALELDLQTVLVCIDPEWVAADQRGAA